MTIAIASSTFYPTQASWLEVGDRLPDLRVLEASPKELHLEREATYNYWQNWRRNELAHSSRIEVRFKVPQVTVRSKLVVLADHFPSPAEENLAPNINAKIIDKRDFFTLSINGFSCQFGFIGVDSKEKQSINCVQFSENLYQLMRRGLKENYWMFIDLCAALENAANTVIHDDLHHIAQFTPAFPQASFEPFMNEFRNGPETSDSHELWTILQHKSRASAYKGIQFAKDSVSLFHEYFDLVDKVTKTLDSSVESNERATIVGTLYGSGLFFLAHLLPLEKSHPFVKSIFDRIERTPMITPPVDYISHPVGASQQSPKNFEYVSKVIALAITLSNEKQNFDNYSAQYGDHASEFPQLSPYAIDDYDGMQSDIGQRRKFKYSHWMKDTKSRKSIALFLRNHDIANQFPIVFPEKILMTMHDFIAQDSELKGKLKENYEIASRPDINDTYRNLLAARCFSITDVKQGSTSSFERLRATIFQQTNGLLEVAHRITQVPVSKEPGFETYWDLTITAQDLFNQRLGIQY